MQSAGVVDTYSNIWDGTVFGDMLAGNLNGLAHAFIKQFDLVISFLNDPTSYLPRLCGDHPRLLVGRGPAFMRSMRTHASTAALAMLTKYGYKADTTIPQLKFGLPAPYKGRYLHFHPGSGAREHNYPLKTWRHLMKDAAEANIPVVVSCSRVDRARAQSIVQTMGSNYATLLDSAPLEVLAASIQNSLLYIGQDSGVTHLAACVNAPGCVLWPRDTNPHVWRPSSPRLHLVKDAALTLNRARSLCKV
jgi:ADP-heptose:LPS heptosyltransferase